MVANMVGQSDQRSKERGGVRRYLDTVTPEEYTPQTGEVDLTEVSLTGLADLYGSDKGNIKHLYTPVYEKLIADLTPNRKTARLRVGEIGVACGASLRMWANYLPQSQIEGFDIRPDCANLCKDLPNVKITISDVRKLEQRYYDLFVDDGSHIAEDIVDTLVHCQNWVRSGGYYVIEDMSCTYSPEYAAKFNQHFGAKKPNDRNLMLTLFDQLSRMVDGKVGTFSEMYYYPQMWVLKKR
jgi:spermidine synthase